MTLPSFENFFSTVADKSVSPKKKNKALPILILFYFIHMIEVHTYRALLLGKHPRTSFLGVNNIRR